LWRVMIQPAARPTFSLTVAVHPSRKPFRIKAFNKLETRMNTDLVRRGY
jgi:hypothetical protein